MLDRLAVLLMPTLAGLTRLPSRSRLMSVNTQSPRASAENVLAYFRCPDEFLPVAHAKPLSAGEATMISPHAGLRNKGSRE
jgi:hypothetical protein